jgi:2-dehydro-3-deoxyphosphooctonate aldolase (KDO 8-P synthase)
MRVAGIEVGGAAPFFLIAGPCVVESEGLTLEIAGQLKELTTVLGVPFIFKASYDKANRSSRTSYRGPGPGGGAAHPRRGASPGRRAGAHRHT